MRGLIVMAMFVASLANATFSDFEETRELNLDAKGAGSLSIEAGAGSMDVTGVAGLDSIEVIATIVVPDADGDKAARIMEKKMRLDLAKKGDTAKLDAWFDNGLIGFDTDAYIVQDVKVPTGMAVSIDDGSGSVTIDDGSGGIKVTDVENDLIITDDGSGGLSFKNVRGEVEQQET